VTQPTLTDLAVEILNTADPDTKVSKTETAVALWRRGGVAIGTAQPPDHPARPARPELKSPGQMPKRSTGPKGRVALVHALAHIELAAIDLAWDIVARFAYVGLPQAYYDDWTMVALEEAEHYAALAKRLTGLGAAYGDLPAHDGLWEAASLTADDLGARLALIPMTLEARGLDVTPATAAKMRQSNDNETAGLLDLIFTDEIKHLAVGVRWFEHLCAQRGVEPQRTYRDFLTERFTGTLKPPFNLEARAEAGMAESYLTPWLKPINA